MAYKIVPSGIVGTQKKGIPSIVGGGSAGVVQLGLGGVQAFLHIGQLG